MDTSDIKGLDKLREQLNKIGNLNFGLALKNGAEKELLPEAKSITPVITGFLRDSEEVVQTGLQEAVLRANAYYAKFVEFGTIYMDAEPFFRPAIDSKQHAFVKVVGEDLENQIRSKI